MIGPSAVNYFSLQSYLGCLLLTVILFIKRSDNDCDSDSLDSLDSLDSAEDNAEESTLQKEELIEIINAEVDNPETLSENNNNLNDYDKKIEVNYICIELTILILAMKQSSVITLRVS